MFSCEALSCVYGILEYCLLSLLAHCSYFHTCTMNEKPLDPFQLKSLPTFFLPKKPNANYYGVKYHVTSYFAKKMKQMYRPAIPYLRALRCLVDPMMGIAMKIRHAQTQVDETTFSDRSI